MKPYTFDREVETAARITVLNFCKTYKECSKHVEELQSETYYAFIRASKTFNKEKKTKFSTWYYHNMWDRMLKYRRQLRRVKHFQRELNLNEVPNFVRFNTVSFMECLSKDASTAVMLAINPTRQMEKYIRSSKRQLLTHRGSIKQELTKMGWSDKRIRSAFREVRVSLGRKANR